MRVLQRGLLRHAGLKISALLIATALWVAYNSEPVVEGSYNVPLLLENIPPGLQVTGEVPSTVLVRMRGRLGRMRPLNPGELSVSADFNSAHAGSLTVQLVPNDPDIVSISPAQVQFSLVSASAPPAVKN
jgi:hypothetical protein